MSNYLARRWAHSFLNIIPVTDIVLPRAEYVAKYNLGYDVPYTTYQNSDVTQSTISNSSRGDIRPIWELLYNHYGVLKQQKAPWTKKYRDLVVQNGTGAEGGGGDYGTTSGGFDQLGYGTLMFTLQEEHGSSDTSTKKGSRSPRPRYRFH